MRKGTHNHPGWTGRRGDGYVVNFSVSSGDVELLIAIEVIAPGYMEPARSFRGLVSVDWFS